MADSIVRLRIDSHEYDANIKRAGDALKRYFDTVKQGGGTLAHLDEGVLEATKALGQLGTKADGTRASLSEMTSAFTDFSMRYKQLSDEEKNGDIGKALRTSLDQLKGRIKETKSELADIDKELYGGKFGQFGNVIDTIGRKMGVAGNLTELLTSKTALMTAGIGAAVGAIYKGTEAWTKYNAELAKQDQQTTVITGLSGMDATGMTDKMRAVVDTYRVDFRQAIEAANTLMTQFGESGDSATKLIKDGMQGMLHGDGQKLLQMIQQYAPAFRDAGVSASQLIAVIQNSEGGIFTSENMNAIVMGIKNIRLMTKPTADALSKLGLNAQEMSRQMSDGSMTVFDALKKVAGELKNCEAGSKTTGEVMQSVFGRAGVTAGQNLSKAILSLNTNLEQTKKQTGEVGEAFSELEKAYEGMNTALRDTFGFNGWQEMATGIKTDLISALSTVIEKLGTIKGLLMGMTPGQAKKSLYGTSGVPEEVQKDIEALKNAKPEEREQLYQQQRQKYEKRYQQQVRNEQTSREVYEQNKKSVFYMLAPDVLKVASSYQASRDINNNAARVAAEENVLNQYNQQAKEIVYGGQTEVKVDIKPTNATDKLKQLNEQLKTLKKQREEARRTGDVDQVKSFDSQISSVQSDINLLKGGGSVKKEVELIDGSLAAMTKSLQDLQKEQAKALNPQEWQESQKEIEKTQYQIEAFKGKWKDGLEATFKIKAEIPDERTVTFKADDEDVLETARQINGVSIDPKTLTVTALTEDAQVALQNVEGIHIQDKEFKVTAETQAVLDKLKGIAGVSFDPKTMEVTANTADAYNQCQELFKKVEGTTVTFDIKPKIDIDELFPQRDITEPYVSALEKAKDSIRSNLAAENIAIDEATLATLLQDAVKSGIDSLDPVLAEMQEKMAEGLDIPVETWQKIIDDYNKIKKQIGEDPIKIDLTTGKTQTEGKGNSETENSRNNLNQLVSNVTSITRSLQDLGVEIPEGFSNVINIMNIIQTIIQTMGTMKAAGSFLTSIPIIGPFLGMLGFANGGVVPHAANGAIVPGTHYSGDVTPVLANAGETILSMSQSSNLLAGIKSLMAPRDEYTEATISADQIRILIRNGAQKSGKTIADYLGIGG